MKLTENKLRQIVREEIDNLFEGSIYEDRDKSSYETLAKLLKLRGLDREMEVDNYRGSYRLIIGSNPYAILHLYTEKQISNPRDNEEEKLASRLMDHEKLDVNIANSTTVGKSFIQKTFTAPSMRDVAVWIDKNLDQYGNKRNEAIKLRDLLSEDLYDGLPPRWTETPIKKAWTNDDLRWISDNIERSAIGQPLHRSPIKNIKTDVLLRAIAAYIQDSNTGGKDERRAKEILNKAEEALGIQGSLRKV